MAPPKHVSETKNNPQENYGKDYAKGEGKTDLRPHCSKMLDSLCCCTISSVAFCTSLSPPGHQGSATSVTDGGYWLCLTTGGRMREGGGHVSASACTGQAAAQAGIHELHATSSWFGAGIKALQSSWEGSRRCAER